MLVHTLQKMKFSIKDFSSKCDQIRNFLRNLSHLLKKAVMKNFIFCAVPYPKTRNQKHPPDVFYKKKCSEKFFKIHGKTLVPEFLFNKNFIKKETLAQLCSCEFCEIFKNTIYQNTSVRLLLATQSQKSTQWLTKICQLIHVQEKQAIL